MLTFEEKLRLTAQLDAMSIWQTIHWTARFAARRQIKVEPRNIDSILEEWRFLLKRRRVSPTVAEVALHYLEEALMQELKDQCEPY